MISNISSIRIALICLLLVLPGFNSRAELFHADTKNKVELIIFYPGSEIYELEGHAVLRIATRHSDRSISYGTFDFNQPNFVYRFVKGETDYMAAEYPTGPLINSYRNENRRAIAHTLDLDQAQTERLIALLDSNLLPENCVYRYNYAKDNCATRPLALIEAAVGDTIVFYEPQSEVDKEITMRQMLTGFHANYPWYQFGIDLALGSDIDRPLTTREKTFAPVTLNTLLPDATINGRPLVSDSRVLVSMASDYATLPTTPWWITPLSVFWILFIICGVICIRQIQTLKIKAWVYSVFFSILGLAGLLLTFLIFFSEHYATSPNWLYLWINPLCFIPGLLIWLKKCKQLNYWYLIANFAVLSLFLLFCWILPQSFNAAVFPIALSDWLLSGVYIYLINAQKHKK